MQFVKVLAVVVTVTPLSMMVNTAKTGMLSCVV